MPYAVLLHITFVSMWIATLVLCCAACAERVASGAVDDAWSNMLTLRMFALFATVPAVLAVLTGIWLAYARDFDGGWLPVKLGFVVLLTALHIYIGRLAAQLRDRITHSQSHYLIVGLAPMVVSLPILYLVLQKPV